MLSQLLNRADIRTTVVLERRTRNNVLARVRRHPHRGSFLTDDQQMIHAISPKASVGK